MTAIASTTCPPPATAAPAPYLGSTSRFNRVASLHIGRDNLINVIEVVLDPIVLTFSVWMISFIEEGELTLPYLIVSLMAFSLTFPAQPRLEESFVRSLLNIVTGWLFLALLIVIFGYATKALSLYPARAIITWLWAAPLCLIVAHTLFRLAAPMLLRAQGAKRAVIIGMNEQGAQLASRLAESPYSDLQVLGFFDDRNIERLHAIGHGRPLLGRISEAAEYVKQAQVNLIYISLPMATQPRIMRLLDELRDTTASIYFVPDLFVTDIIQSRMETICDMPVVSVCETPFTGTNGLTKRLSDIVLSLPILLLISPILLVVAAGVKLSSPGPVIFKQRRYGLDGQEIVVYKFRSMTVCEDGGQIAQARKGDQRITRLGAVLRKTSLDELPQFVNVLQGRMSIVGPRPHAVAHNEQYRKLINGYMVRHKVKPGITGWAQVNGLRGETETLDKMKARVECDLDYLRHWSLGLDLYIILKTVGVVFKDQYAY
ncbi:undecaprenyl-phosphate glucose phosphotransferase [Dechloromonas denitrificans]|uniref:undecaprenyl-phosphate glucose phosphotransferase n=1 Tax=Dechloromonas denitrificans TaxID=281362 RepID=UPI001CFAF27C|nr:undecaprenyl-phosphate glucose phosphotransferase [Dechloromonas denitrificans]